MLIEEATENVRNIYERSKSQNEAFADRLRRLQVIASFTWDEILVFWMISHPCQGLFLE